MLLAASIFALLAGPVLLQVLRAGPRSLSFLDGFAFITIAGLLCFGILPAAIADGGNYAWLFAVAGLVVPFLLERVFHRGERQAHIAILVIGALGLASHALLDGVALAAGEPHGGSFGRHDSGAGAPEESLALAVVLHRLPEGIAVWYLIAPSLGVRAAAGLLGLLIAGSTAGYVGGEALLASLRGPGVAWFQAFVAGAIMHVVLHGAAPHVHGGEHFHGEEKWPERLGLLCGLILLFLYL
jgi:zinc transporter ZupT